MKNIILVFSAILGSTLINLSINDLRDVSTAGGTDGAVLTYDSLRNVWKPVAASGGGADLSGTADNQVLYNNSGSIGGADNLAWDETNFVVKGSLNPSVVAERTTTGAAYFRLRNTSNEWQWYSNNANAGFEPNTVNGVFYMRNLANNEIVRFNFGTTAAASSIELMGGAFLKINAVSASPTPPALGMVYVDSDDNHMYFYNGSTWVQMDN